MESRQRGKAHPSQPGADTAQHPLEHIAQRGRPAAAIAFRRLGEQLIHQHQLPRRLAMTSFSQVLLQPAQVRAESLRQLQQGRLATHGGEQVQLVGAAILALGHRQLVQAMVADQLMQQCGFGLGQGRMITGHQVQAMGARIVSPRTVPGWPPCCRASSRSQAGRSP